MTVGKKEEEEVVIVKVDFDEKKLLSNFLEDFKEEMPERRSITVDESESVAEEIKEEALFSSRPSITHRPAENCFLNFKATTLPGEI